VPDAPTPSPRFFDLWSLFYDLPWIQRLTYRPVHDAVIAALRAGGARDVLDVGCGTGLLAARLTDALPGVRVVGCDFSHGMLRRAAAERRPVPRGWVQGDALRLPFSAAAFDAVVSTEAFHWFPDQARAVAEFHRVLAPGGRLLVGLVNPPFEIVGRVARLASRVAGEPFEWPTRRRMRDLFEAAGFRVDAQRWIPRIPAALLLPPVLTIGVRSGEPAELRRRPQAG
jgi:ubiquinone/menaquinone biosynthesis C-methylase UbiE